MFVARLVVHVPAAAVQSEKSRRRYRWIIFNGDMKPIHPRQTTMRDGKCIVARFNDLRFSVRIGLRLRRLLLLGAALLESFPEGAILSNGLLWQDQDTANQQKNREARELRLFHRCVFLACAAEP